MAQIGRVDFTGDWPRGPQAAHMPPLIAAINFIAVGFSVSFATGIGAIGSVALAYGSTLLGIGLSLGLAAWQASQKPPTPKAQDVQANIRQALAARRRHHSRVKVGSVLVFGFRRNQKIYVLHYIGEGPINGFVTHFLNNKPVTLDASGFVTDAQYQHGGRSRVQILTKLGTMADEPFDEIIAAFPELDTPLKPFRHRGCAMVLQIVEEVPQKVLAEVYPNNLPSYQTIIDGLSHYDPRDGSTALTGNAGLCLLAETMAVYGLTSADTDDIDFDAFETFADHCDEAVTLKAGGTEPRYSCAGTILMDAENEPRIRTIADVCNADVFIDRRGRISVRKRVDTAAGIALRAKNGDHLAISLESGRGLLRKSNTIKGVYVESALNWKEHQAIYRNADAFAADGRELSEPFDIRLCPSSTQGQRLTKLRWFETNPAYAGSMTSGLQALELIETPVFTCDLAPEDDLELVCSASNIELDEATLAVQFGLVSHYDGAEDWDAATEEQDIVEVPPDLAVDLADIELEVTATVEILSNSAPVITFEWAAAAGEPSLPDSWSQQVQVSVAGEDLWFDANVNEEQDEATFGPVADGGAYDWRIRNIAGGSPFEWQVGTTPVTVTVDPTPPGALSDVVVTGDQPGHVDIAFTSPSSTNLAGVKLYRAPTGVALDRDAHIVGTLIALPGFDHTYVDGDDTVTNLVPNGTFDDATGLTLGTGWSQAGSEVVKTAGTASEVKQAAPFLVNGTEYRYWHDLTRTAGGLVLYFYPSPFPGTTTRTASGEYFGTLTAASTSNEIALWGNATFAGSVGTLVLYEPTDDCAPQGAWDYYLEAVNRSNVAGSLSGPHTAKIR